MELVVDCPTCHREELWRDVGEPEPAVEVRVEGGGRRPAIHPQWARGRTALAAQAGQTGKVVGVCPACGHLLVARDPYTSWPAMTVRVDTPRGPLVVGETVRGPGGEDWTRSQAEAFLAAQYRVPITDGLVGDLGRTLLFFGLVGPVFYWVAGIAFMIAFLSSMLGGPVPQVSGTPGFDLTGGGAPTPREGR